MVEIKITQIQVGENSYTPENLPEKYSEILGLTEKLNFIEPIFSERKVEPMYRDIQINEEKTGLVIGIRDYITLEGCSVGETTGRGIYRLIEKEGNKSLERILPSM